MPTFISADISTRDVYAVSPSLCIPGWWGGGVWWVGARCGGWVWCVCWLQHKLEHHCSYFEPCVVESSEATAHNTMSSGIAAIAQGSLHKKK